MSVHSSQSRDALISVRLVVADHYQAPPITGVDPLVSDFSGYSIKKVPVIRVFGSTPAGQRVCLHVHGIFPYIYVPLPAGEKDGFVYRLAASLDKAINISMQQGNAAIQHVYKAVMVSGIPMYGYHPRQHTFVKIYFYNPFMVKRAADLLQGGAVMNKILQPHESHTNYVLQWMMDYNLQGMNEIHLSHAMFRQGKIEDEYEDMEPIITPPWKQKRRHVSMDSSLNSEPDASAVISNYLKLPPDQRTFHVDEMEECLKTNKDISRQSTSELEIDAVAADIINHQDVSGNAMNPGLVALWEDERIRRRQNGIEDPLTPPGSPTRDPKVHEKSESEKFWFDRLCKAIEHKKLNETLNDSPDVDDPDATINLDKKLRPHVYAVESTDHDVTHLPGATQLDPHIQSLSDSILNVTASNKSNVMEDTFNKTSYGDETVVDEELILTQMESGDNESDSDDDLDEELVDMLADLATEAKETVATSSGTQSSSNNDDEVFKTPKSMKPLSQHSSQGKGSGKKLSKVVADALEEEEEQESLEMSQVVWDTTEGDEDDEWDELDKTLMENFAKDLEPENCDDMEDMFK